MLQLYQNNKISPEPWGHEHSYYLLLIKIKHNYLNFNTICVCIIPKYLYLYLIYHIISIFMPGVYHEWGVYGLIMDPGASRETKLYLPTPPFLLFSLNKHKKQRFGCCEKENRNKILILFLFYKWVCVNTLTVVCGKVCPINCIMYILKKVLKICISISYINGKYYG